MDTLSIFGAYSLTSMYNFCMHMTIRINSFNYLSYKSIFLAFFWDMGLVKNYKQLLVLHYLQLS